MHNIHPLIESYYLLKGRWIFTVAALVAITWIIYSFISFKFSEDWTKESLTFLIISGGAIFSLSLLISLTYLFFSSQSYFFFPIAISVFLIIQLLLISIFLSMLLNGQLEVIFVCLAVLGSMLFSILLSGMLFLAKLVVS